MRDVPQCRRCARVLFGQPGEIVERRHPRPLRASTRCRCHFAAQADAGPATGKIRHRVGTRLAALGAAFDRYRAVSGGVLGRSVAGAAVRGARRGFGLFLVFALGVAVSAAAVSLAEPRTGARPARSRLRHPPSPGDRAHRYAGHPGPGGAGAVAGAARAHAGLDQAHPRRPAVAAACDPRSLGAARAGRGDAGCDLCRRRRRARDAGGRGVRLERRVVAGQCQGRRLGDAADLHRQASDHPVGGKQGSRDPGGRIRCRSRRARR